MKPVRAALLAALIGAAAAGVDAVDAASRQPAAPPCERERAGMLRATGDANDPGVRSMRRRIDRALVLFRLHKRPDALRQVDAAARDLQAHPSLFARRAARMTAALSSLRKCVSTATPPALATVDVRVFRLDGGTLDAMGARDGAGIYIRVDDVGVGRTKAGGTLRVEVPAGSVRLTAVVPSTAEGRSVVTVEPGGSSSASIGLDGDRDVIEETDLVLAEARDGVVAAGATSLTLRFVSDAGPVALRSGVQIDLLDHSGGVAQALTPLFRIADGAIVAADVSAVMAALRRDADAPVRLQVQAVDADGFTHANDVQFRIR
ncbi:MAG TPA: hypothetical protein VFK57_25255 [Vicinamibacterales bacterium]|nr:hypothetical protein [Vicinamibacterales bacterium]